MPDRRVTLRKKQTYQTRSNKTRLVRVPGGKLVVQSIKRNQSTNLPRNSSDITWYPMCSK
eukprot:gnl/Chilomastix_caulleri/193.p2 GENE.gnl/Chilomastix_caulleri/193~~gnl/Chilomastix_caulleri/193.p2  ORF type:complete len:60 (+),score=4.70 gnl/Chilomastix_caulleri/193:41-220(+)